MTGVGMWLRAEWRRSVGGLATLAVLLAVAGGVVLAFAAGSRRADSALDRFQAATQAPDVVLAAEISASRDGIEQFNTHLQLVDRAAAIEGVESVAVQSWWALALADDVTPGQPVSPFVIGYSALSDGARPAMVVRGELPGPNDDGVVVNEEAERLGLTIGSPVTFRSVATEHFADWAGSDAQLADDSLLDGPTITTRVVAVTRSIDDISSDAYPQVALMPGFDARHGATVAHCDCFVLVHTDGTQAVEVADQLTALYAPYEMEVIPDEPVSDVARLAIDVEVITLRITALVAAAAAFLVAGQAFGRSVARIAVHHSARRAIGMTTPQLVLGTAATLAPALIAGLIGAVVTAAGLSPLFPVGLARRAEVEPGLRLDTQTLLLDAPLLLASGIALVGLLAWRTAAPGAERGPLAPRLVTRVFHRPAPALGASFTVDPLGGGMRSRFVAVTTFVSVAVAVAAGLTVATIASSTHHLRDTPELYGASGNFVLDQNGEVGVDAAIETASALPGVTSVTARAAIDTDTVGLAGARFEDAETSVQPASYRSVRGDGTPSLIEGRLPDSADEVAIGHRIADDLGAEVGDTIQLETEDGRTIELVDTGTVVDWTIDSPDRSFIVTDETLHAIGCPDPLDDCDLAETVFAAADDAAAIDTLLAAGFLPTPAPANVARLDQVGPIPWYLAGFLSVLALAGIGHALASAARRRRPDLAIVRALGLSAGETSRSFGWQAGLVAVVGTVIGLVFGTVTGRVVWGVIAANLGVLDRPVVPVLPAAVGALAMVTAAIAIAVVPAVRARRLRPVELLRAE